MAKRTTVAELEERIDGLESDLRDANKRIHLLESAYQRLGEPAEAVLEATETAWGKVKGWLRGDGVKPVM